MLKEKKKLQTFTATARLTLFLLKPIWTTGWLSGSTSYPVMFPLAVATFPLVAVLRSPNCESGEKLGRAAPSAVKLGFRANIQRPKFLPTRACIWVVSKNRGVSPKMDGYNDGKPYKNGMIWGVKPTIFGNIHIETKKNPEGI